MLSETIGKLVRVMNVPQTDSIIVGIVTAVDMLRYKVLVQPHFGEAKWCDGEHVHVLMESDL
jgi:hypothetical protein